VSPAALQIDSNSRQPTADLTRNQQSGCSTLRTTGKPKRDDPETPALMERLNTVVERDLRYDESRPL